MSNEIYVTGHRNPDTDSIASAIAYAALRNALGDREYKAVRIGAVNDETNSILDFFGLEAPPQVKNMRTQVCDIDFDRPPILNGSVTLDLAWRTICDSKLSNLPIADDAGHLIGVLSKGDVAAHDMQTILNNHIEDVPVFNLISVLDGRLVNEFGSAAHSISGNVSIAIPQEFVDYSTLGPQDIVICGDQPEVIQTALENKISCLILCQTEIPRELAESTAPTCIISTPLDARVASRLIFHAVPVERVCEKHEVITFHLSDYLDDVKEMVLKSRYRCYTVLDENDIVVGILSRYHLLRPSRKRVVLVDHNEASQSVSGLDQVEIMEIIDHHRLADIQTTQPVYVRNEPVGCTCTILTSMYQERGVVPTPKIAGIMAAAILSDTVMFKSPTCTKRDIAMAERLAKIARVSLDEIGRHLFSTSGADDKTAEELFRTDYKEFHISEQNIGVSQITCADSSHLLNRSEEFLSYMRGLQHAKEYDLILLMITDVLNEGTYLLYTGNIGVDDTIQQAFSVQPKDNQVFLPRIMSRKKQLIPMLTALWG